MKLVFFLIALVFAVCAVTTVIADDEECQDACPLIYLPICGRDANNEERSFPNDCVMQYTNCNENKNFAQVRRGNC